MSVDLAAIRVGLQTAIGTLDVNAYDVWPDQIICPAAMIKPKEGQYHFALGRNTSPMKIQFEVTFLAAPIEIGLALAQNTLDPYLGTGTGTIQNAIEADQSLSSTATSVVCQQFHSYGSMAVDQIEYAGVIFDVEVTAA